MRLPFLFSKYSNRGATNNRMIVPINEPKDHNPLIAAIVISLVAASLLAINMHNTKVVKIASLRGACGIKCHIQEAPIYRTVGEYRRGMERQREGKASH